MVFSGPVFILFFLPAVILAYYSVPKRGRNVVLFFSSLIFYGWGEPKYILLMLVTVAVGYFSGVLMARTEDERARKRILILTTIFDLGVLGFFKYAGFFAENLNALGLGLPAVTIALPLGISFYTFQTLSYTIDVYRRDVEYQRDFLPFATYVTMFPQLVAGPIVRYHDIAIEMESRTESLALFGEGVEDFLFGFAKKMLLANTIGAFWNGVNAMANPSTFLLWIGIVAFSLQIYFDFSGYSDMAIGLGKMFGFHFMKNFDYPYLSRSVTEFWRRWHISLGTWFREYVYIPLGGNRVGAGRFAVNLFVVWFLTGLWHGASWNFALWGLYYGVILYLEKRFFKDFLDRHRIFGRIYTLFLVVVGWGIFERTDLKSLGAFFATLFSRVPTAPGDLFRVRNVLAFLVIGAVFATDGPRRLYERAKEKWAPTGLLVPAALFLLSMIFLVNETYNPFLYFRF